MTKKQTGAAAGVYAALVTPRRPNSREADTGSLLDYLDCVTRAGVDGLVLFGSTGEFVHFEIEERMRVVALAVKRSRVPVLVNVSHSTLSGACELAGSAVASCAAGLLLMPPYFYRYTDAQIAAFYHGFQSSVGPGVCLYLYNLPFFTNPLSFELIQDLIRAGGITGIKDSSGDWSLFEQLRTLRAQIDFQLLAGHESIYKRAAEAGADGTVSGVSAAVPELLVALQRAIRLQNSEGAERLNTRLLEFVDWIARFPSTVAIRQAAAMRGWINDDQAVPLDAETAALADSFRTWFEAWIPEILRECAAGVASSIVSR
ncbi:MAG: dihydrodipicolinate synthase family protein [Acidobacteriaceae bacterium]|nr:dihydrodipicolinate synthase family protein [Acidobacteriaceae bacterium]